MNQAKKLLSLLLALILMMAFVPTSQLTVSAASSEGTWKKDSFGDWNYFINGNKVRNTWVFYQNDWYYLNYYGDMLHDEWFYYNNSWYYLGSDGRMFANKWFHDTGWSNGIQKDDWYYLGSDGRMFADKWAKDSCGWCYLGSDGIMKKCCWLQDGNVWYQLDSYGYIVKESNTKPSTNLGKIRNLDDTVKVTKVDVDWTDYAYAKDAKLTWSSVDNATSYEVYINTNNCHVTTVKVGQTSYTLPTHAIHGFGSNLNIYPYYMIKVRACMNIAGETYYGPWNSHIVWL